MAAGFLRPTADLALDFALALAIGFKGGKFKKRLGKFKKRLCEILLPWPTGIPDVRRGGALVCVLMAGHACADDLGSHALLCVCMHRAPARSPKAPPPSCLFLK